MEGGWALSAGMRRSRDASTSMRSSSKNKGSFIVTVGSRRWRWTKRSRFVLAFGIERLGGKFAVGFFQQDFDAAFGFFKLLLAFAGKGDAFFEELHGVVKRKLGAFEAADDFLETSEGALKIGLFWRLGLLGSR